MFIPGLVNKLANPALTSPLLPLTPLQDKVGTAFLLVDSFAGGVISALTVGRDQIQSLKLMAEALDFVQLQLGVSR